MKNKIALEEHFAIEERVQVIDHRNGWMKAPHKYAAKHPVAHCFRNHLWLTTSDTRRH